MTDCEGMFVLSYQYPTLDLSSLTRNLFRRKRGSVAYQLLQLAHFKVVGFLLARVMVTTRRPSEDAVSKIKEGEINKRGSHVES
jgi:hypothetical protein